MNSSELKRLEFVKALAQEQGLYFPLGFSPTAAICAMTSEAMHYENLARFFKGKAKSEKVAEYQEQAKFYTEALLQVLNFEIKNYLRTLKASPQEFEQRKVFKVAAPNNPKRVFLVEASNQLDLETQFKNLSLANPKVLGSWESKKQAS
ncbi:MAG: hypothetical protein QNL04_14440 [SAR324 cluster bacterium]|nr:hypothetical protein [SAR324 cluster bacterium]